MKKEPKMAACQHCGAEMAASAKTCPQCGAKNKKPLYKRPWFIAVLVIIVLGIIGGAAGGSTEKEKGGKANADSDPMVSDVSSKDKEKDANAPEISYTTYDVSELVDDLDANAMKASEKYKGQYVELRGRLSVIDSSGKYISIEPVDRDFCLTGVRCTLKNDEQKAAVMELSIGDTVVVKGKITEVGEVMGYSLKTEEICK